MDSRSAPRALRGLPSWLVSQASLTAAGLVSGQLSRTGAHRWHYSVLAALHESGPASQAELGRRVGLDRSDVTAAVGALASAGQVVRETDPADRRRNTVRISDRGTERLQDLDRLVHSAQDQLLAPLSPAEREELVRLLTVVVDHHGAVG
ncbi:MarR family winged helix-turn-helix transcriptional regulator [Modestobacter altitudinis]|uniref:MarR family winged helix-turn-helix transcriptional regulator n=1 Tax=Modestobacter altitudinis TaxID=2213158 RepID=UPI00110CA083|nr:MarR family transcriptional regulator [Modestobacter altitudinis]